MGDIRMKHLLQGLLSLFFAGHFLGASGCGVDTETLIAKSITLTGSPTHGAVLFSWNCAICHGEDGLKSDYSQLPTQVPTLTKEDITKLVYQGGGAMTAVARAADMSEQDVADVVAYVQEKFK